MSQPHWFAGSQLDIFNFSNILVYYPICIKQFGFRKTLIWLWFYFFRSLSFNSEYLHSQNNYFGPTRFIHRWTTLVNAMLRVSDVTDKRNSWLADVTFGWRHVTETAVKCYNKTRRFITFPRVGNFIIKANGSDYDMLYGFSRAHAAPTT